MWSFPKFGKKETNFYHITWRSWVLRNMHFQDAFDHDKGQKSTISRRRLHWIFSSGVFLLLSRFTVQVTKEMATKDGENCPISGRRKKSIESCHVSGCHGFSVPNFRHHMMWSFWPKLRLEVAEGFHIMWGMLAAHFPSAGPESRGFAGWWGAPLSHQFCWGSSVLATRWGGTGTGWRSPAGRVEAFILARTALWHIIFTYEYRSSKWHYRQIKMIFKLIMHFIADTDADENYFGIDFSEQMQTQLFLAV